jgi:DNA polymerase-1
MIHYIENSDSLKKFLKTLNLNTIQLDTETSGFDPHSNDLLLIQIGGYRDQAVINFKKTLQNNTENIKLLKDILENPKIGVILHNAKFDYKFIKAKLGIELNNIYDTMIAAYVARAGLQYKGFSLAELVKEYNLGDLDKSTRQTFENHDGINFSKEQIKYSADDVVHLEDLHEIFLSEIKDMGLEKVYNLERECIAATGDMELNGIYLDYSKWAPLEAKAKKNLLEYKDSLDEEFFPYCEIDLFGGPVINYNSPQQVKPIMEKIVGEFIESTDKNILARIDHPVADKYIKYKAQMKKISAYGTKFYTENLNKNTGRIHSNFVQIGATDSGRYASKNPNMQQIPAEAEYRSAFCAPSGKKIVGADYSGMELRLLAEFSGDPEFKKIFKLGLDGHSYVATMVTGIPIRRKGDKYLDENGNVQIATEDLNKEMRKIGKSLNFGIAYGMGASRLAKAIDKSYDEANEILNAFWQKFPFVESFLNSKVKESLSNEYVKSHIDGRIRWLKGFNLRVPKQKAHASNIAKNMSLQSVEMY